MTERTMQERALNLRLELDKLPDHYRKGADGGLYHAINPEADRLIAQALEEVAAAARDDGKRAERTRIGAESDGAVGAGPTDYELALQILANLPCGHPPARSLIHNPAICVFCHVQDF